MAYKDGSLLLQPEVAGLFDKVSEISFELAVLLPSTKVLRLFLKQRVHHLFGLLFFHDGSRGHLFSLGPLVLLGCRRELEAYS